MAQRRHGRKVARIASEEDADQASFHGLTEQLRRSTQERSYEARPKYRRKLRGGRSREWLAGQGSKLSETKSVQRGRRGPPARNTSRKPLADGAPDPTTVGLILPKIMKLCDPL